VLEEDIEHRGAGQATEELPPLASAEQTSTAAGAAKAIWQHQLGAPLPTKIFALDNSTDEVQLRGSFNAAHSPQLRREFLADIFRILAPGGVVSLHMLTASKTLTLARGTLAGPASYVTHTPALDELLSDLTALGFQGAQLTKYGSRPCFTHDGAELRETMLVARKPAAGSNDEPRDVVYLGPLAAVRDDSGREFARGERVTVPAATWQSLVAGPLGQSFACLERNAASGCSASKDV
jgi:hypothetical protein